MIKNKLFQGILLACLFILVLISVAFFEMAFAFFGDVFRFIASFLLNVIFVYYCTKILNISKKARVLITFIFPLLSVLSIIALVAMQQSHRGFHLFFPF